MAPCQDVIKSTSISLSGAEIFEEKLIRTPRRPIRKSQGYVYEKDWHGKVTAMVCGKVKVRYRLKQEDFISFL